jgi:hypothetical protein
MTHPLAPMGDPALQGLSARQAVILTALPVEYQAVRAHLTHLQAATHPRGTLYERGQFRTRRQVWEVAIAQLGVGNSGTAQEAAVLEHGQMLRERRNHSKTINPIIQLIEHGDPQWMLLAERP